MCGKVDHDCGWFSLTLNTRAECFKDLEHKGSPQAKAETVGCYLEALSMCLLLLLHGIIKKMTLLLCNPAAKYEYFLACIIGI